MSEFPKESHNRVRRVANRGHYDRETIFPIIDEAPVAHVGFSMDDRPFIIPMLHGRKGDTIYLHASRKSRIYKHLLTGIPICIAVTHVDGYVIARSAFHHSMNYRSVVAHGTCRSLDESERADALRVFTEKLIPGRWDECRPVHEKEIQVTGVLAMEIETASAKIRTGDPGDEAEDYALPIWAGVVPIVTTLGEPIPDPAMTGEYPLPESVKNLQNSK